MIQKNSALHARKNQIILILCILILTAACGGGGGSSGGSVGSSNPVTTPVTNPNPNTQNTKTYPQATPIDPASVIYANHLDGSELIRFYYPINWGIKDSPEDPEVRAVMEYVKADPIFPEPYISVVFKANIHGDIFDDEIEGSLVSSIQTKMAGYEGTEEIYDTVIDGLNLRILQLIFRVDEFFYGIQYATIPELFNAYANVVRYMAKSMAVGQVIFDGLRRQFPSKPVIATDGNNFLVVSCKETIAFSKKYRLLTRLIHADGTLGTELQIDQTPSQVNRASCADMSYEVVFDGTNYQLYYQGEDASWHNIYLRRISANGTLIDTVPINLSSNASPVQAQRPTAVFGGNKTLVVWSERPNDFSHGDDRIRGKLVNPNGSFSATFSIATDQDIVYGNNLSDDAHLIPKVAYGNNQFMAIWGPPVNIDAFYEHKIYGQLINSSGNLLLSAPVLIVTDTGPANPHQAQITSDGDKYLVAWRVMVGAINSRLISSAGALLNGNASSVGKQIVSPLTSDFNLTFNKGKYQFFWSSLSIPSRFSPPISTVEVSSDLLTISAPRRIVGVRTDTFNAQSNANILPDIAYTADNAYIVSFSDARERIEGWYLNNIFIDN